MDGRIADGVPEEAAAVAVARKNLYSLRETGAQGLVRAGLDLGGLRGPEGAEGLLGLS